MSTEFGPADIGALCQAVSDDLTLLSALHATELQAQTLADLKALGFPEGLGLVLSGERSLTVLKHLGAVVQQWPDEVDTQIVDILAADYAAIYLNGQIGASPYESYWLDEDHLVMQKPMFQVRDRYHEYGMEVENWRDRADDHVVNELCFVAELVARDSAPESLKAAACFMDEHLLRWLPQFAERIGTHSDSDFYIGLGLLTAEYCEELRDLMAVILQEARPDPHELEARMSEAEVKAVKVAPPRFEGGPGW